MDHGIENFPCRIIDPMSPDSPAEWVGGAHELIASNANGEGDVDAVLDALRTLEKSGDSVLCGFVRIERFSL